jgi:hypothetical protein
MYYIRIAFAVIGGVITGALNLRDFEGAVVGVGIFLVTYLLFRYGIKSISSQVKETKKFYMTGIFSYFLLWFVMWIISIDLFWIPLPSS